MPTPLLSLSLHSPRRTLTTLGLSLLLVMGLLEGLMWALTGEAMPVGVFEWLLLHLALIFVGWDIALGLVLMAAIRRRLLRANDEAVPSAHALKASLLIAGWNEASCIVETVKGWAAQRGVEFEILVGDDGSTDGTAERLRQLCALRAVSPHEWEGMVDGVSVRLLRFDHAGKGATLNALARRAANPVLVTTDADTTPAPNALAALISLFGADDVDLATGVVTIRNGRHNWLLANQSAEYLKNAWARIAWSELSSLEQVPGAFAAIRTSIFRSAGGFPTDSLTEDYELTFRVVAAKSQSIQRVRVATSLAAQVFTDGPATARGFIQQRTRWFAGFLSTLFRFRRLVFEPRAAAYGLVRLPLKVVDAGLPVLAFASLIILVRGGVEAALGVSRVSVALFMVRWLWDLFVYACATRFAPRLGHRSWSEAAAPPLLWGWVCTSIEALTYVWFKHVSALRGMLWAVRRVRDWETSRMTPAVNSTTSTPS